MLLALFADHSPHQLETHTPLARTILLVPTAFWPLTATGTGSNRLVNAFQLPKHVAHFMLFAISFASVALQVFMDTGLLNSINKNSFFFSGGGGKGKSQFISPLFCPKNTIPLFFFLMFTCRWTESLPPVKLQLKCFPGEKSQLVDQYPCHLLTSSHLGGKGLPPPQGSLWCFRFLCLL